MTIRVRIHPGPWTATFERDHVVRIGRGRTSDIRVGHQRVGGRWTVSKDHVALGWKTYVYSLGSLPSLATIVDENLTDDPAA